MGACGAWRASSVTDSRQGQRAERWLATTSSCARYRGNGIARLEAYRPLLTALMTLTMVLLTVDAAMVAPSQAAWGASSTPASKMDEQSSAAAYGLLRYSEGSTPLLGGSVLIPSFSEEDDEDECVGGSLVVGMFVVWLVGLVSGLVRVCREPRRLRTIYEYPRLERPG
jgi:hypothetical protein